MMEILSKSIPSNGIDIIDATARDDWSGVWGDSNRFTYYIHQVINTFWMAITTPLRDLGFVGVFQGTLQSDGVTVAGSWCGVPLGETPGWGYMHFTLNPGRLKMVPSADSQFAGRVLKKLYNADGHACPTLGPLTIVLPDADLCQVKEIGGASVSYAVANQALANIPDASYTWTTTGAQIVGSNSASTLQLIMPPAGTAFKVSVDITISGLCHYHADRAVTSKTPGEASRDQLWCEIRTLAASMGTFKQIGNPALAGSGNVASPVDPVLLERLQKVVDRLSRAIAELRHQIRE